MLASVGPVVKARKANGGLFAVDGRASCAVRCEVECPMVPMLVPVVSDLVDSRQLNSDKGV